jgi:hypothetical protein
MEKLKVTFGDKMGASNYQTAAFLEENGLDGIFNTDKTTIEYDSCAIYIRGVTNKPYETGGCPIDLSEWFDAHPTD